MPTSPDAAGARSGVPDYPMSRTCPFAPPVAQADVGPIGRVRIETGAQAWLVTDHADQRDLLVDPRLSSDFRHDGFPQRRNRSRRPSMITLDGAEHRRLRRMAVKYFTVKRIAALRPVVDELVDDLLTAMVDEGPDAADLVRDFALPLPSLVICRLLGVPYADHDFFQRQSSTLLTESVPIAEREAAVADITGYLSDLVDRKIAEPGDDLTSELARDRVATGELTRDELADLCVLLLVAGHETTANMIALGTMVLLEHPEQLAALRAADQHGADDGAAMAAAVEELLRYLTIVHHGLRRVAVDDMEIAGQPVAAGEGVIVALDAANRSPDAFDGDPDAFDIDRAPGHHLAFGFGIHQCLGQALARLELEIAYRELFRRLPGLRVTAPQDHLDFKDDMFIYGIRSLPVSWDQSTAATRPLVSSAGSSDAGATGEGSGPR